MTEVEDDEEALKYEPAVKFSGEEVYGKYLDLHEQYNAFINTKFGEQIEYYEYLTTLLEFDQLPKATRLDAEYKQDFSQERNPSWNRSRAIRNYITALLDYLEGFYERTHPLASLSKQYHKARTIFPSRRV